jgi:hypothetical protein
MVAASPPDLRLKVVAKTGTSAIAVIVSSATISRVRVHRDVKTVICILLVCANPTCRGDVEPRQVPRHPPRTPAVAGTADYQDPRCSPHRMS